MKRSWLHGGETPIPVLLIFAPCQVQPTAPHLCGLISPRSGTILLVNPSASLQAVVDPFVSDRYAQSVCFHRLTVAFKTYRQHRQLKKSLILAGRGDTHAGCRLSDSMDDRRVRQSPPRRRTPDCNAAKYHAPRAPLSPAIGHKSRQDLRICLKMFEGCYSM